MFRRRFPDWHRWGLSAFYARSDAEIEDLAADQLERFPMLGCYRVADLRAAGFDLDERLAALVGAAHEVRINSYHEADDGSAR